MQAHRLSLLGSLAVAALLALAIGPAALAQKAAAPSVTPREGVPGTLFTFYAPGFKGAVPAADEDENLGEQIAYWINTPDGKVIATEPLSEKDEYGNTTRPLLTWANGHGEVMVRWHSPTAVLPGAYTMVLHGRSSDIETVIPFALHEAGWQTVLQSNVTPRAGPAGTRFHVIDTGFVDNEKVAFWINTPDGDVIATETLRDKDEYGNTTRPLMEKANGDGVVNIYWYSPKDLEPGIYSLIAHGLDSHHQVLTYFTIN
jgi:hypothetical protein